MQEDKASYKKVQNKRVVPISEGRNKMCNLNFMQAIIADDVVKTIITVACET